MTDHQLDQIYEQLRAKTADERLEALFDLKKRLPGLNPKQKPEVASAVSALFFIDLHDTPEFEPVVNQAVKIVTSMGIELVSHHLEEMKGADMTAQDRFSMVLAGLGVAAIEPIVEACQNSDEPHFLVGAIYALAKITDPSIAKGLPVLLKHAEHTDSEVRDTSIRSLGKMIDTLSSGDCPKKQCGDVFQAFLKGTHDAVAAVRAKAVRGLGKMSSHSCISSEQRADAVERIKQILGCHEDFQWDTAFIVRREAEEALERLGDTCQACSEAQGRD